MKKYRPSEIDKMICEFTFISPLQSGQTDLLAAFIFNKLFADGNVHTMPDDGEHYESSECFCHPKLDFRNDENSKEHWIHVDTRKEALQ